MKRKIKFRAWNKTNKWMDNEFSIHADGCIYQDARRRWDISDIAVESAYDDLEIMQFTGLLDKSGKEIYERDIVKGYGYEVRNGHQIRPERIFAINDFIKDTYRLLCITEGTGETVEIIGNIYENPELLT
jgi:uncharacterized phage protein (TIGR01671 family)